MIPLKTASPAITAVMMIFVLFDQDLFIHTRTSPIGAQQRSATTTIATFSYQFGPAPGVSAPGGGGGGGPGGGGFWGWNADDGVSGGAGITLSGAVGGVAPALVSASFDSSVMVSLRP
jgi:hypothetical protein